MRAHCRRFDESTATRTPEAPHFVLDTHSGDLRKLADAADGDVERAAELWQQVPGIGPAGADIVQREVQAVWPWVRPFFDDRAKDGAKALGLPVTKLDTLVGPDDYARFASALVRVTLDEDLAGTLTA